MKINNIMWESVKVEIPELKKTYDWTECSIMVMSDLGSTGKHMTVRRYENDRSTADCLVFGSASIEELTPWTLKVTAKAVFDDKLWDATITANF